MGEKAKILVVEDELQIAELIRDYLIAGGFDVTVITDGAAAQEHLKKHKPDLLLLDLMLPGVNGIEICQELRKTSDIPVIMMTARIDEIDRLIGFTSGADDYICKPVSPREVVARVKAVLRRTKNDGGRQVLNAGILTLEADKRKLTIHGVEIPLTPTEFNILWAMVKAPERVFSRGDLIEHALEYNYKGYERVIDTHVKNLRRKLSAAFPAADLIVSVYGLGYKFIPYQPS